MVTAGAALRDAAARLAAAGVEDASFDAAQLLAHAGGPDGRLWPDSPLSEAVCRAFRALVARRAAREPLQYILGSWDFLDFTLAVGPGALIPRQDTETLAGLAIGLARQLAGERPGRPVRAADLCAGTGALGLALARHVPGVQVTAVELSGQAFAYLRRNNEAQGSPMALVQADALCWRPAAPLDLVVSNPPYVTAAEYAALAPELYAEPRSALVPVGGEEDGLLFYRAYARSAPALLAPGGALAVEIGERQGPAVTALFAAAGLADVALHRDAAGNPRAVTARRA